MILIKTNRPSQDQIRTSSQPVKGRQVASRSASARIPRAADPPAPEPIAPPPPPSPTTSVKILPEMLVVPWQLRPNRGGGRGVEIPWIRRAVADLKDKTVADFGCLDDAAPSTADYEIDPSNRILYFDNRDASFDGYRKVDFLHENFAEAESIDVGICVSVIEHVGLPIYRNSICADGDFFALRNILATIKPGGRLLLTVPASEKSYAPLYWMRSYSPAQLASWSRALDFEMTLETYQYVKDTWYSCPPDKLRGSYHYEGNYDVVAVACMDITKK